MTVLRTMTGRDAHPGRVTDETDPQVPERARRRSFPAAYKLEVLAEYDAAGPGEKGAVLRRHGLYSSHVTECASGARPTGIARTGSSRHCL